jgi:ATP-dependent DNA helicase PIF1
VNGTLGTVTALSENSVRFRADGATEETTLTEVSWEQYRYRFREGQFVPEVIGTYRQIPLTYGWAITIHKAQGLTLDSACVDLGTGAFASGQTYVALSRTRSIADLTVRRPVNQRDFIADVRVSEFYERHGLQ